MPLPISVITDLTKIFEKGLIILFLYTYKCLDGSRPSLCVFLNLAEAFNTVHHGKLLELSNGKHWISYFIN